MFPDMGGDSWSWSEMHSPVAAQRPLQDAAPRLLQDAAPGSSVVRWHCMHMTASGLHRGPVWGVRWFDAETAKARVFVSLSADGRLVMWSLVKDKLQYQVRHCCLPADGVFTAVLRSKLPWELPPDAHYMYVLSCMHMRA